MNAGATPSCMDAVDCSAGCCCCCCIRCWCCCVRLLLLPLLGNDPRSPKHKQRAVLLLLCCCTRWSACDGLLHSCQLWTHCVLLQGALAACARLLGLGLLRPGAQPLTACWGPSPFPQAAGAGHQDVRGSFPKQHMQLEGAAAGLTVCFALVRAMTAVLPAVLATAAEVPWSSLIQHKQPQRIRSRRFAPQLRRDGGEGTTTDVSKAAECAAADTGVLPGPDDD